MSRHSALQKKFMLNLYPNRGLTFSRGEGAYLISTEGEKYLDMMSNYGVNILGYTHTPLHTALAHQIQTLPTLHCSFANETRAKASQRLVRRVSDRPAQVYWANSGAEAIEAALKFAASATGKKKFIACHNSFHGKTLGALSATHSPKYKKRFEPLLWQFTHIHFDDQRALADVIDAETAAFIVEPIQGEAGVIVPEEGYLESVRQICADRGVLMILDEIQTGTGRTGAFLASHRMNYEADIICLGKGLGGGIPIGATIVSPEIAAKLERALHTSTFGGNPLACAGVLVVLDFLCEEQLQRISQQGDYFLQQLRQLQDERVLGIRGRGLMLGIVVRDSRDKILKELQFNKVLAVPAGNDVVRFLPPYIIDKKHVDLVIRTLEGVLRDL